jgi:hypothetical protein
VLTRAEHRGRWSSTGVLAALRRAASDVSLTRTQPLTYAVPELQVLRPDQDTGRCGVPSPSVAGTSDAIAVVLQPAGGHGCGVRVELYRDARRRIDGVALYRPSP